MVSINIISSNLPSWDTFLFTSGLQKIFLKFKKFQRN